MSDNDADAYTQSIEVNRIDENVLKEQEDALSAHESETETLQDIEQDYQEESQEIAIETESALTNEYELIKTDPFVANNDLVDSEDEEVVETVNGNGEVVEVVNGNEEIEMNGFNMYPDKPEGAIDEQNTDFHIDAIKTYSNSLNDEDETYEDDTQNDVYENGNDTEDTEAGEEDLEDNFSQSEIEAESTRLNFLPTKNFHSCKKICNFIKFKI